MFSFLETMGIIFCFFLISLALIFAYYAIKDLVQKLIKRLSDPRGCPECRKKLKVWLLNSQVKDRSDWIEC